VLPAAPLLVRLTVSMAVQERAGLTCVGDLSAAAMIEWNHGHVRRSGGGVLIQAAGCNNSCSPGLMNICVFNYFMTAEKLSE
jgi:hypothetical protein